MKTELFHIGDDAGALRAQLEHAPSFAGNYEPASSMDACGLGLARAAEILRGGGLVCFPTETVYGLGANALLEESVRNIFRAKGRPSDNPLIVHISDFFMLDQVAQQITETGRRLMEAYFPGPITLLFLKKPNIPDIVTAGLPTVGVRMPDHPVARELIRLAGVPVCAPSANRSTKPSPTEFSHCFDDLNGKIDAIIDGGPCRVGVESTVVDVSGNNCEILRPGGITLEQIQKIVPEATVAQAKQGQAPRAPGMKYKHYSPDAQVYVLSGPPERAFYYIGRNSEQTSVVLAFDQHIGCYPGMEVWPLGDVADLSQAANRLFHYFRQADKQGIRTIYCEDIPCDSGMGLAVKNRLYKASREVIQV